MLKVLSITAFVSPRWPPTRWSPTSTPTGPAALTLVALHPATASSMVTTLCHGPPKSNTQFPAPMLKHSTELSPTPLPRLAGYDNFRRSFGTAFLGPLSHYATVRASCTCQQTRYDTSIQSISRLIFTLCGTVSPWATSTSSMYLLLDSLPASSPRGHHRHCVWISVPVSPS